MKTTNELRDLSIDNLNEELLDLRKKQFDFRMRKANGTLDKTHVVAQIRKSIARIKTLISEKKRYQDGS